MKAQGFTAEAGRGFTLIELLIVVAIIAILAAIAVPNFLEAQTRSKVSRAKADMRSLGTAIEAYCVDNNKYPTASWAARTNFFNNRMRLLTTPMSYITSLPVDPFRSQRQQFPDSGIPSTYDYMDREVAYGPVGDPNYGFHEWAFDWVYDAYMGNTTTKWSICSPGPKFQDGPMDHFVSAFDHRTRVEETYDPTNGTVSFGGIWRTNAMTDK